MKNIIDRTIELLKLGIECTLVTIIDKRGSTPRSIGTSMIVTNDGIDIGTVGGGSVEYNAMLTAKEYIKTKKSGIRKFVLTNNQAEDIGMVCGGENTLNFQYLSPNNEVLMANLVKISESDCAIVLDISNDNRSGIAVITHEGISKFSDIELNSEEEDKLLCTFGFKNRSCRSMGKGYHDAPVFHKGVFAEFDNRSFFAISVRENSRVFIFGGGHVSRALCPVLSYVNFHVTVFDDREEFSKSVDFPDAVEVSCIDFDNIKNYVTINDGDYVCVMTRGHKSDFDVLKQVVNLNLKYLGVIGSRSKSAKMRSDLKVLGVSDEIINSIKSPIGLDIGSDTPEEIAISIVAQMIMARSEL